MGEGRSERMGKDTTATIAKGRGGKGNEEKAVKVAKFDQRHINAIEKRLSLAAGSLPIELGSDLAMRYGTWLAHMQGSVDENGRADGKIIGFDNIRSYNQINIDRRAVDQAEGRISTMPDGKPLKIYTGAELSAMREKVINLKQRETSEFMKIAMDYVEQTYGAERRENGQLVGYGDRIEVKKGHLHKIW